MKPVYFFRHRAPHNEPHNKFYGLDPGTLHQFLMGHVNQCISIAFELIKKPLVKLTIEISKTFA